MRYENCDEEGALIEGRERQKGNCVGDRAAGEVKGDQDDEHEHLCRASEQAYRNGVNVERLFEYADLILSGRVNFLGERMFPVQQKEH